MGLDKIEIEKHLIENEILKNQIKNTCENTSIKVLGAPTWTNQCHFNNLFGSAGRATGGLVSDDGSLNIDVNAGTGFIKALDDDTAQLFSMDWVASTGNAIPDGTRRYVGVEYNSGSPQVDVRTSENWDLDTEFPLASVIREDGKLHILNNPWWVTDGMTNIIERFQADGYVVRDNNVGGMIIADEGNRNLSISAGVIWSRLNEFPIDAIDTSATDTIEYYWYNGVAGTWNESDVTAWSGTQWNNTSLATLQNLNNNYYYNTWVYVEGDDLNYSLIYAQAQHTTLANAEAEAPPTLLPTHIQEHGLLIGRIISRQGTVAAIGIESAFDTVFSPSSATSHNNLAGLQGGTANQYYHLTSSEYTELSNWLDNVILSTDGSVNFNSTGNLTNILSWSMVDGFSNLDSSGNLNIIGQAVFDVNTIYTSSDGSGTINCSAIQDVVSQWAINNDGSAYFGVGNFQIDTSGNMILGDGVYLDWNSGDVRLTHSSNLLTLTGGNLTVPTLNATTLAVKSGPNTTTITEGSMTSTTGSLSFGSNSITTTGRGTFGNILLTDATHNYLFTNRTTFLALQSQTSSQPFVLEMFTKDGDNTDNLFFRQFTLGTPASIANSEFFEILSSSTGTTIYTRATGTGTANPLSLGTNNTAQMLFNVGGDIELNSDLEMNAKDIKEVNDIFLNDGYSKWESDGDITIYADINSVVGLYFFSGSDGSFFTDAGVISSDGSGTLQAVIFDCYSTAGFDSNTGDGYVSGNWTVGPQVVIDSNAYFKPVSSADSSAPNNSIYYSTTQSKLVYKDSGGSVNNLY